MSAPLKDSPIVRAATAITNIVVAGTAAAGAAALHSWAVLALGGVTYGALVAIDLVRGRASGTTSGRTALTPLLRPVAEYQDPAIRHAVTTLVAARNEVFASLAETPDDVKVHLTFASGTLVELLERAARLADRGEVLAEYLRVKDPLVVARDIADLRDRAVRATDAEARGQYEIARASREEHLALLSELAGAKDRVVASVLSIAATLEAFPAKVVRMRALDAEAMDKLSGDLNQELSNLGGEMKTIEESLEAMGQGPGELSL